MLAFTLALALATTGSALSLNTQDRGHEVRLNYTNWAELVLAPNSLWFVNVYKESCGHCIQNRPIWKEFIETEAVDGVQYGALDCDYSPNLCE